MPRNGTIDRVCQKSVVSEKKTLRKAIKVCAKITGSYLYRPSKFDLIKFVRSYQVFLHKLAFLEGKSSIVTTCNNIDAECVTKGASKTKANGNI